MLLGLRVRKKPYHRVYYECCNAWKQAAMLGPCCAEGRDLQTVFSPFSFSFKEARIAQNSIE